MKNSKLFLITAILITGCNEPANIDKELIKFDSLEKSFKREIPTHKNGRLDHFYFSTKDKQKNLHLDSLENGFDGLQIRIWYDDVNFTKQKLVVITYKMRNWTANLYKTRDSNMLSKDFKKLIPKTGWINFSNKLLNYKILILPNGDDVQGCGAGGGDGSTYNVEIATKKHYRYYGYWQPQDYLEKCPEAKNMNNILKLLDVEFDI